MTNVIIENRKIYSKSSLCEREDVFEIVDKIPHGYFVWNIGENMGHDEYITVCQSAHPGDKDCYEVNTRTLKAVRLDVAEVKLLRKAAGIGINSLETAEKAINSKRRGYWSDRKRAEAEKVIDIFRRISK